MRQQTPTPARTQASTLTARLRAAWSTVTGQPTTAPQETAPVEDFATRLQAAVRAAQH